MRSALVDYFQGDAYGRGEPFRGEGYEGEHLQEIGANVLQHRQSGIRVSELAVDIRSGGPFRVVFHYTTRVGIANIMNHAKKDNEIFASLEERLSHFGKGIYAAKKCPAQFGNMEAVLVNNYWPRCGDPEEPQEHESNLLLRGGGVGSRPDDPRNSRVRSAIFLLTSLSASIVAVPQKDAADRMSILLALILSVAAYKSSVAGMLPAKKYLTRLDKYIITAFCGLFVVSVWVAILALASDEDYGGPIVPVTTEITVLGCGLVIWLACHVYLLCCSDNLYPSWGEVIRDENDQLKSAKDCVEKRRMESSKDSSQQEPVRENTGDSEAGDEDLEAERGRKHGKRMQPGVPEGRRDDDPRKQPGVPEEAAWLS